MVKVEREAIIVWSVLVLLPILLFGDIFFLGNGVYQRDLAGYHYPMKHVVRESLLSGELPLWNRYYAAGQPMAANPAYEIFYPPQLLVLLPDYRLGFNLHIFLHLFIAETGLYLLLRSLGLRRASSLFGAVTFVFGGCVLSLVSLLPFLFSMSWMPWVFLLARRAFVDPRPRTIALASIPIAMQFLVCEPVTILQTQLVLGMYGLYRVASLESGRLAGFARNVGTQLAAIAGGALLGAAQLFPAIDHARDSIRRVPFEWSEVSNWSFPPVRILEFIFPSLMGPVERNGVIYWGSMLYPGHKGPFIVSIYAGILIASLALAGLVLRRRGWGLVAAIVAAGFVLAIGSHSPLLRVLYDAHLLPSIRYPEKFMLAAVFALIVWGAKMFESILDGDRPVSRVAIGILAGSAVLAAVPAVAGFTPDYPELFKRIWGLGESNVHLSSVATTQWIIAIVRGAAFASALYFFSRKRTRDAAALLVLLICADIGMLSSQLVDRMPRRYFDPPTVLSTVRDTGKEFRIFHVASILSDSDVGREYLSKTMTYWVVRNGLFPLTPSTWGYLSTLELDIDETFLMPTHEMLRVMLAALHEPRPEPLQFLRAISNAGYVFSFSDPKREMQRIAGDAEEVAPVVVIRGAANPRYYFADRIVPSRSAQEFSRDVLTGSWSSRTAFSPIAPFTPAPGDVLGVQERQNDASVDVSASGRALLVASVTRHRYWRATIDGRDAEIVPANLAYQAVVVPPGRHHVEFHYRNPVVLASALVSAISILGTAVVLFATRRREQPSRGR